MDKIKNERAYRDYIVLQIKEEVMSEVWRILSEDSDTLQNAIRIHLDNINRKKNVNSINQFQRDILDNLNLSDNQIFKSIARNLLKLYKKL